MAEKGRAIFDVLKSSISVTCSMKSFSGRKETCFLVEKPLIQPYCRAYSWRREQFSPKPRSSTSLSPVEGHEGFIEQGDIIALGPDILVSKIRNYLPNTDPEPDMSGRGEEYGMIRLRPTEERDLIVEG